MKKIVVATAVAGSFCFGLRLYAYVWPEFLCLVFSVLTGVILLLLFVRALLMGFTKWRGTSRWWMLPSLVCLAVMVCVYFVPPSIGPAIADRRFTSRLAEYSRTVDDFRDGTAVCTRPCDAQFAMVEARQLPSKVHSA